MSAPYKSANIPTYEPLAQRGEYDKWMKMMKETEGDRSELGGQKMDTLKSLLDKIPGYNDMQTGMSNMLTQMMGGQLTDTHKSVLEQQAGGLRERMGQNQGSGAGLNMTLASFGKAGLQAQQSAMSMVPQFMTNLRTSFMGNIANDPAVMGPSSDAWTSQAQGDHRDVYDSRIAQSNASYQADMLNTQYNIQKSAQAESQSRMNAANKAAQDRADRLMSMQMFNQTAMQNSNAYAAGGQGMVNPIQGPTRGGWIDRRRG
jgi:hypothetical protein